MEVCDVSRERLENEVEAFLIKECGKGRDSVSNFSALELDSISRQAMTRFTRFW